MNNKIEAVVEAYEKYIDKNVNAYDTPETPGLYLDKHEGDPVIINKYRSFVGKITFFTTKLSPKTGSATRTLSGHMSSPDPLHWKLMDRLIGYLKVMKQKGILYVKPEFLKTAFLAHTDYGNCKGARRIVGFSFITIVGCIFDYWMAKYHSVSDSSCESEYKELEKCAEGELLLQMMLGEFNLDDLPGVTGEDNHGAIFLSKNKQESEHTKHNDLKYHFIRKLTDNRYGV
uniref:Reverse transcriptase Ty1/copia-type domain-containing protein n=1 Tax=Eucampia antarctica TaxID=49252 RepID=A0A7S2RAE3_9STRA